MFTLEKNMYQVIKYPDSALQVRILPEYVEAVRNAEVIEINSTATTPEEILELLFLFNAIEGLYGWDIQHYKKRIVLNIPYLPYARADRRFCEGDVSGKGMFLQLLECFRPTLTYLTINTLDIHSTKHEHLKGGVFADEPEIIKNQTPQILIIATILNIINLDFKNGYHEFDFGLVFPDKGAFDRYGTMFEDRLTFGEVVIKLKKIFCEKKRDPITGKFLGFQVPKEAKELNDCDYVLMVDDLCDAGGTFMGISDALSNIGFSRPFYLYTTHAIYSKGVDDLHTHFYGLYTTNSYANTKPQDGVVVFDAFEALKGKAVKL